MANTTISMSKIRQILRMYSQGRSKQSIAVQAGVSRNTAKKYFAAFDASGCTFEEINALNDKELEDFFGNSYERPPDRRLVSLQRCFPQVDKELKRTTAASYGKPIEKSFLMASSTPNFVFTITSGRQGSTPLCTWITRQAISCMLILQVKS